MQRTPALILSGIALLAIVVIGFLIFSNAQPVAEPSPSADASASSSASASPSFNAELLDRRWTVLYVGTDVNQERADRGEPVNTDALMLVSLSADQSELTLVSLPRDTVDLPLADGSTDPRKINGLYSQTGLEALVGAMESLYEVPIDAHVVLDMDDFGALVEAVDGVEVTVEQPIVDPAANLDIPAGEQVLDAGSALGYVRTRIDQDYGRMGRQQEVLVALIERLVDPETDLDLRALLDGLDSLETDLPLDDLATLVELVRRAAEAEVTNLVIQPPLITFAGDRNDGRGYVLEPNVEAIRAEVQELIGE